jgi:predicted secreted hydrolase
VNNLGHMTLRVARCLRLCVATAPFATAAGLFAAAASLCLAAPAGDPPRADVARHSEAAPYAEVTSYAEVTPGYVLSFPKDYGSHPQFRTEWWYVTGWLQTRSGEPLGFQITFFRTKPDQADDNPSAFAPHQLLIAHCAISDPKRGRLWQDQRIRRTGLGLAEAKVGDTDVWMDRWRLRRAGGTYTAAIDAEDFSMNFELLPTQSELINGNAGLSRKGPAIQAASYYYSLPHVKVTGSISRKGALEQVSGEAWFDHEWSSEYLDDHAVGWDWIGINMDDGAALMAFRIRDAHGDARWAGGTLRDPDGKLQILEPADIDFHPIRQWVSPRTAVPYPVQLRVRAGAREFDLEPLLDDQENDTRLTTGAVYWEGAVRALERRRPVGRGYLELTGYGERLKLR